MAGRRASRLELSELSVLLHGRGSPCCGNASVSELLCRLAPDRPALNLNKERVFYCPGFKVHYCCVSWTASIHIIIVSLIHLNKSWSARQKKGTPFLENQTMNNRLQNHCCAFIMWRIFHYSLLKHWQFSSFIQAECYLSLLNMTLCRKRFFFNWPKKKTKKVLNVILCLFDMKNLVLKILFNERFPEQQKNKSSDHHSCSCVGRLRQPEWDWMRLCWEQRWVVVEDAPEHLPALFAAHARVFISVAAGRRCITNRTRQNESAAISNWGLIAALTRKLLKMWYWEGKWLPASQKQWCIQHLQLHCFRMRGESRVN